MTKKALNSRKFLSAFIAITLVATAPIGILSMRADAAANSIYVSPSSKSLLVGSDFTVDVRASSTTFDTAQVEVTYPASSLDYLGYSLSGSAFPTPIGLVTSPGSFSVALFGVYPPNLPSGDVSLLKLSFRTKVGAGTGNISVGNGSGTFNGGVNLTANRYGSSISFTSPPAPAPTPAPAPAPPAPAPVQDPKKPTPPAPVPAPIKPNEPTLATASNPTPSTTPEQVKNDPLLAPQDVKAIITIKDLSGKLVRNTTVKINDKEYKTDKNGKVTFEGKAYGVLTVTYSKDGKEVPLGKVTLVKGATDTKYEIIASENIASPSSTNLPILPGIVSVLLIAVGFFSVTRINKIRQDRKSLALHGLSGSMVSSKPIAPQAQPVQTINSDNITTNNPSATIIKPTEYSTLSDEDLAEAAKKIVEDK